MRRASRSHGRAATGDRGSGSGFALGAIAGCVALVAVVGLWVLLGYVLPLLLAGDKPEDPGIFGDQFGAVNSLFSGLALGGLVVALILQSRDIKQAMRAQTEAAQQHARTVRAQIILALIGDMRSEAWGEAHHTIANFRRKHGKTGFVEAYLKARGTEKFSDIDKARRRFKEPLAKLASLVKSEVATLEDAGFVFPAHAAATYVFVVHEMELALAAKLGNVGPDGAAGIKTIDSLARKLHPELSDPYPGDDLTCEPPVHMKPSSQ